ncbi:hypothetical protein SARC_08587 [Sphaeroforma arctica JP610]|uniref:BOP1 N-terminal domain-containing protein n=1 Tax=Sphaeroforma arctica JP610 TaxID=667725 RepID=A0A0L0FSQ9_9EUKA|nr:hypothetical protein SARC_08587 [Sphaeroforma arctica JP610]KNC78998.1 hypothetical protein SARC_08587 [Sphaeroforma arctica JP610]|eukprot:XP_014152900.1 hypothetical protein SARC_08587 [Sphaeroforma arctica JP610]
MGAAGKRGRDKISAQATTIQSVVSSTDDNSKETARNSRKSRSKTLDLKSNLQLKDQDTDTEESEYEGLEDEEESDGQVGEAEAFGLNDASADENSNSEDENGDTLGVTNSKGDAQSDGVEDSVEEFSGSEGELGEDFDEENEDAYTRRGGWAGYEDSDSDDEIPANTVGNIPLEWYDDYEHVGYDLDGKKNHQERDAG